MKHLITLMMRRRADAAMQLASEHTCQRKKKTTPVDHCVLMNLIFMRIMRWKFTGCFWLESYQPTKRPEIWLTFSLHKRNPSKSKVERARAAGMKMIISLASNLITNGFTVDMVLHFAGLPMNLPGAIDFCKDKDYLISDVAGKLSLGSRVAMLGVAMCWWSLALMVDG